MVISNKVSASFQMCCVKWKNMDWESFTSGWRLNLLFVIKLNQYKCIYTEKVKETLKNDYVEHELNKEVIQKKYCLK